MAGKRNLFQYKIPTILKQLLLGVCCTIFVLLSQGGLAFSKIIASEQIKAQQLTQMGHMQLHQGEARKALGTWEKATKIYRDSGDSLGIKGSLINQSLALKELGLHYRACQTLVQALELEYWVCASQIEQSKEKYLAQLKDVLDRKQSLLKIQIIGLSNLGNVLRLIGRPDGSEIVLQKALFLAKNISSNFTNQIALDLANTKRVLYIQARNKYQLTSEPIVQKKARFTAASKLKDASEIYENLLTLNQNNESIVLRAKLNKLSLFIEYLQWKEINTPTLKALQNQELFQLYVKQLLNADFRELPAIESVYAQLNFVVNLIKISQNAQLNQFLVNENIKPLSVALSSANDAYRRAQKLNNKQAISYALETIGNIYNNLQQTIISKQYFVKALSLAKSVQDSEISYRLEKKLGRLYQKIGSNELAKKLYADAINSLEIVRGSIRSINPEFQFNFKEKVEPVYREYIDLLLSQSSPNFQEAIQTSEQLKLAELENFLQCGKLNITNNIQKSKSTVNTVYLINSVNQVHIIVQTPEGKFYQHTTAIDSVSNAVDNFLNILQSNNFLDFQEKDLLIYPQILYKELIAPIKQHLPSEGKLIFVLDNYFQNLPLAMLHDGKDYLIKSYDISIASSPLGQSIVLRQSELNVVFAGISESSPSLKEYTRLDHLSPLPEVATEAASIEPNTDNIKLFFNKKFTSGRFQQLIESSEFPIIHISTHGKFSSDPEETFILAWDKPINVREFDSILKNRNQNTIDLLVLSACQTAKGDVRSSLGIAGVAVMAGARSTLATLWLVDAGSTASLMGKFYEGLRNGFDKSQALRQAQLTLLKNPKYNHPYYWAPFILVTR